MQSWAGFIGRLFKVAFARSIDRLTARNDTVVEIGSGNAIGRATINSPFRRAEGQRFARSARVTDRRRRKTIIDIP